MAELTDKQSAWFADAFTKLADNVGVAIVGKQHVIRLVVTSMLSGGHVLLEDVPGTGKTVLAKALANTLKSTHSRIQFTPDLLPSDVTGVTIYDQAKKKFEFHKGPIFASIVLADEINRASPKTQSALLEVMEEGAVTVEGESHQVGSPFMVIATQNPVEQAGTYRLPEAQLDRFLMKTSLGYPDKTIATQLLVDTVDKGRAALVTPVVDADTVSKMVEMARKVYLDPAIAAYVMDVVEGTREDDDVALGVSTRGALALVSAVRTWALAAGRAYVTPDDVRDLALPVLAHRLIVNPDSEFAGVTQEEVVDRVIEKIQPPAYRTQ